MRVQFFCHRISSNNARTVFWRTKLGPILVAYQQDGRGAGGRWVITNNLLVGSGGERGQCLGFITVNGANGFSRGIGIGLNYRKAR